MMLLGWPGRSACMDKYQCSQAAGAGEIQTDAPATHALPTVAVAVAAAVAVALALVLIYVRQCAGKTTRGGGGAEDV